MVCVFWDRNISTGLIWRDYIGKALDTAKCVIVVWSRYSVTSDFVHEEADDGRERKILIPIRIDDVRPPLGFRSIQHEDLTDWRGELDHPGARSLIKAIESIAGKPQNSATEPSIVPELAVEQKVDPQKPSKTSAKPKPFEPKTTTKESAKMSSAAKVFCLINLVAVFITGLIIPFREEPTQPVAQEVSQSVEEKQPPATQPDLSALKKNFINAIGMEFELITTGEFMMGSSISPEEMVRRYGGNIEWFKSEHPWHSVEITNPFYMQKTEVTQMQWKKVMEDNPSYFNDCGDDSPVENVSCNDIQQFIKKLNDMESTDTYRWPTEAEWEYAARTGTTMAFSFGDNANQLG
jgi:hypothetical protein